MQAQVYNKIVLIETYTIEMTNELLIVFIHLSIVSD